MNSPRSQSARGALLVSHVFVYEGRSTNNAHSPNYKRFFFEQHKAMHDDASDDPNQFSPRYLRPLTILLRTQPPILTKPRPSNWLWNQLLIFRKPLNIFIKALNNFRVIETNYRIIRQDANPLYINKRPIIQYKRIFFYLENYSKY